MAICELRYTCEVTSLRVTDTDGLKDMITHDCFVVLDAMNYCGHANVNISKEKETSSSSGKTSRHESTCTYLPALPSLVQLAVSRARRDDEKEKAVLTDSEYRVRKCQRGAMVFPTLTARESRTRVMFLMMDLLNPLCSELLHTLSTYIKRYSFHAVSCDLLGPSDSWLRYSCKCK